MGKLRKIAKLSRPAIHIARAYTSEKKPHCKKSAPRAKMGTHYLFRVSSAVEQWTVNPLVASSNLAPGVSFERSKFHTLYGQAVPSGHDRTGMIEPGPNVAIVPILTAFALHGLKLKAAIPGFVRE